MHLQFWKRKPLLHSLNQGVIIVYHFHILDFGGGGGIHFQSMTVDYTSRLFDVTSHIFFLFVAFNFNTLLGKIVL